MPEYHVAQEDSGLKLAKWCKLHVPQLGYGLTQKLIRKGDIKINGKKASLDSTLIAADTIRIYAHIEPQRDTKRPVSKRQAREIQDMIIFENNSCFVLNKPAGLAVQGGSDITDSIDSRLEALQGLEKERPKLVHRLDKDTSGILLIGKNRASAARLTEAFRDKQCTKIYWALVVGVPDQPVGEIALPLAKQLHQHREKMSVVVDKHEGKEALTHYRVVQSFGGIVSWVELRPITGRTHQLRVHLNAIGHPIYGDGKYGGEAAFPNRIKLDKQLHLHAKILSIPKPIAIKVEAHLPYHMQRSWKQCGFPDDDLGVSLSELI